MEARLGRRREDATAMAIAFNQPEDIEKLYPKPVPPAVKWWGGEDA